MREADLILEKEHSKVRIVGNQVIIEGTHSKLILEEVLDDDTDEYIWNFRTINREEFED